MESQGRKSGLASFVMIVQEPAIPKKKILANLLGVDHCL
jgi:hypothetical protein